MLLQRRFHTVFCLLVCTTLWRHTLADEITTPQLDEYCDNVIKAANIPLSRGACKNVVVQVNSKLRAQVMQPEEQLLISRHGHCSLIIDGQRLVLRMPLASKESKFRVRVHYTGMPLMEDMGLTVSGKTVCESPLTTAPNKQGLIVTSTKCSTKMDLSRAKEEIPRGHDVINPQMVEGIQQQLQDNVPCIGDQLSTTLKSAPPLKLRRKNKGTSDKTADQPQPAQDLIHQMEITQTEPTFDSTVIEIPQQGSQHESPVDISSPPSHMLNSVHQIQPSFASIDQPEVHDEKLYDIQTSPHDPFTKMLSEPTFAEFAARLNAQYNGQHLGLPTTEYPVLPMPTIQLTAPPTTQEITLPNVEPTAQVSAQPDVQSNTHVTAQPDVQSNTQEAALSISQITSPPQVQLIDQVRAQPDIQPIAEETPQHNIQFDAQAPTQPNSQVLAHPYAVPIGQPFEQPHNQFPIQNNLPPYFNAITHSSVKPIQNQAQIPPFYPGYIPYGTA